MKQSYITFLLVLLMSIMGTKASAHDIAVANSDGKTIYYVWTNNNTELAVSYRGSSYSDYYNEYTGYVAIPESVTYNGITYSVTSIVGSAFEDCTGLTSVTIPSSVTSIGFYAFYYTGIYANAPNGVFYVDNWVCGYKGEMPSNTSITLKNGTVGIAVYAFLNCSGLTSVTIPLSVTSIGHFAFYGCSGLTSVTIPSSVKSIGSDAFEDCSGLTSVTIQEGVTSIGNRAFYGCSGLNSVTIPSSVTSIGYGAFYSTGIYANSPDGVFYVGNWVCGHKGEMPSNTSISLRNGTVGIADYAFNCCYGLTSVTIPSCVMSIGDSAFEDCTRLTSVTIPSSVTSIGDYAFKKCLGLNSITVATGNSKYDSRYNCNAIIETATNTLIVGCKNTTIPNTVTSIAAYAFYGYYALTSVTIPSSVTSIGSYAFYNCLRLASVVMEASIPISITDDVFLNRYEYDNDLYEFFTGATLYVPYGSKAAYQAADVWKDFKAIKEYPDHDVNQDGTVNVVDVVDIARYVVATPAESFDVFLADLNSDKVVNVADAVVLVNDIAGDTNWSRGMLTPEHAHDDVLALTENDDHSLSLLLEGSGRYTAFQFDLTLPADVDVAEMGLNSLRKQQHQLLYNKEDEGTWRVVALSTSNREFEGASGELLNMALDGFATDEVRIDNIHFVTAQGIDVPFAAIGLYKDDTATGLAQTAANTARPQKVYNLNGQRMNGLHKGLNIVDGKKIVIR